MSDTGQEWQVVRRRKGTARRTETRPVSPRAPSCQEQLDTVKTVRRIKDTVAELRCEDIWREWREQLLETSSLSSPPLVEDSEVSSDTADGRTSPHFVCVCYGLGSFSSCVSARYQLAMMLLLLEAQQIPVKDCSVFDPVFSAGEKDVLRELGLTVLSENEEGKRLVTRPTVFYLMHCGKALYNNLLWRNWSPQRLRLVVIIGNSFAGMRERMIDREFKRDYSYLSQAASVCEETQLTCPSRLIDVFSDTAVITFPSGSLVSLPQATWTEPPEPQYQHCPDLEIVLREPHS